MTSPLLQNIENEGFVAYLSSIVNEETTAVVLLFVVFILSVVAYFRIKISSGIDNKRLDERNHMLKDPKVQGLDSSTSNDVWEERRKRGIFATSSAKKGSADGDKPFGSRYYYAHNCLNAKGGYTDGLRMEDYTMNGPRLLSKGGVRQDIANESQCIEDNATETVPRESPVATGETTPSLKTTKTISKYLWDDPGDSSGVATIRIDTLPGNTKNENLAWKDARIQTVSANLEGEGLVVVAKSDDKDNTEYILRIPRLFDKASEVRAVIKAKRLLVKIQKKRSALNFLGKSNLDPWPHPHRKHFGEPILDQKS